ncbi:hypothetical protein [Corynebacterium glyciniphilum]|uniref:hypothetical protein n=1 Tax=Corynebacterium glyciniphilum TaxID=1404244 RepID=UPI001642BA9F|nr:hypothetical protein [Corynebacterium glyciniphilum]MDN5683945.1 hypothetical protein [Corynebacterium glyciniphilum]MDN6704989.1 hypothetical protein [Corynebacterium glyciniphilum]
MNPGTVNIIAWTAELVGLVIVLLGVLSVLPDRFLAAGLLLMVIGIFAKLRANRMTRKD